VFTNSVGRITPAGAVDTFPLRPGVGPFGITSGADGNLWITEVQANKIGRLTPSGAFLEVDIPTPDSQPDSITLGPDDNLWFTEAAANKVGRVSLAPTSSCEP
jgi:virginiamycin B lyase